MKLSGGDLSESQQEQAKTVVLSDGREREGHRDLCGRCVDLKQYADGDFVRRHCKCSGWFENPCHFHWFRPPNAFADAEKLCSAFVCGLLRLLASLTGH